MFDLETAIANWKQSLAARESLSVDSIDELETHLRDSIATLATEILNVEEAFLIARRRVGSPGELGSEYEKENPSHVWVQRLKWMSLGYLFFTSCGSIGNPLVGLVLYVQSGVFPAWSPMLTSFVGRGMCLGLILGTAVVLTTRRSSLLDRIQARLAHRSAFIVPALVVSLIVLPPVIDFGFDLVRLGSDVDKGEVFMSMFPTYVLFTLPTPALVGTIAVLLHRRERVLEPA